MDYGSSSRNKLLLVESSSGNVILLEEGESSDDELPLDDESSSGDATSLDVVSSFRNETILDQEDEGDYKIGEREDEAKNATDVATSLAGKQSLSSHSSEVVLRWQLKVFLG